MPHLKHILIIPISSAFLHVLFVLIHVKYKQKSYVSHSMNISMTQLQDYGNSIVNSYPPSATYMHQWTGSVYSSHFFQREMSLCYLALSHHNSVAKFPAIIKWILINSFPCCGRWEMWLSGLLYFYSRSLLPLPSTESTLRKTDTGFINTLSVA